MDLLIDPSNTVSTKLRRKILCLMGIAVLVFVLQINYAVHQTTDRDLLLQRHAGQRHQQPQQLRVNKRDYFQPAAATTTTTKTTTITRKQVVKGGAPAQKFPKQVRLEGGNVDDDDDGDDNDAADDDRPYNNNKSKQNPAAVVVKKTTTTTTNVSPLSNKNSPDKYKDDPTKPYFIFHMGPPKTATTTIQYKLTRFIDTLKRDNYFFIGTTTADYMDPLIETLLDRDCMLAVNVWRIQRDNDEENNNNKKNSVEMPACWRALVHRLDVYRQMGQNLIISEEWFSIQFANFDQVGRTALDWIALREVLAPHWNVRVVFGYRRLYDILPSAKQQWDRWFPHVIALNEWPPMGRTLEPLFPKILDDPHLSDTYVPRKSRQQAVKQWSYTDYLIESVGRYFNYRILDFHKGHIRTCFMCDILPHASNSCALSRQMDQEPETKVNAEQSLFYDALTTAAAEKGWIDTKQYRRHDVANMLLNYYENSLQRRPADLDQICPSDDELSVILERSLVKEKRIMPHIVSEEDHRQGFEEAKQKKKFCWVDTEKTLARPEIQHFFDHLSASVTNKQQY